MDRRIQLAAVVGIVGMVATFGFGNEVGNHAELNRLCISVGNLQTEVAELSRQLEALKASVEYQSLPRVLEKKLPEPKPRGVFHGDANQP